MYSRYYPRRPSDGIKLPENYNGCAFQKNVQEKKEPMGYFEVAKPTPLPEEEPRALPMPTPREALIADAPPLLQEEEPPKKEAESVPASALPAALPRLFPFLSGKGAGKLFSGGLDFDQLLLLGLILLLWGNDGNTELILCLALLLFCG